MRSYTKQENKVKYLICVHLWKNNKSLVIYISNKKGIFMKRLKVPL